jgi:hypothetical protein
MEVKAMNNNYKETYKQNKIKGDKYENECYIHIKSGKSLFGIVDFTQRLLDTANQLDGIDIQIENTTTVENIIYGPVTVKGTTNIDCKHYGYYPTKMKKTEYGVDVIPVEITKYDGSLGWGIDPNIKTTYLIMRIDNYCSYVINSLALRRYLSNRIHIYENMFDNEKKKVVKAVSVKDLMDYHIIRDYKIFK